MYKKTLRNLSIGYVAVVAAIWTALISCYVNRTFMFADPSDRVLAPLIIVMFVGAMVTTVIFLMIGIGCWVHQDARQRGMPPLPWALAAGLVPYFVGLIAYLIARKPMPEICPACGKQVPKPSLFCPNCGHILRQKCPACDAGLDSDHKFCPACGTAIGK